MLAGCGWDGTKYKENCQSHRKSMFDTGLRPENSAYAECFEQDFGRYGKIESAPGNCQGRVCGEWRGK